MKLLLIEGSILKPRIIRNNGDDLDVGGGCVLEGESAGQSQEGPSSSAPDEFGEFHVDELHDVELEAVAEVVNQVDAVGDLCPGQHG